MARNALALGLARPFTWLSATGLTILIPRYLGDESVGKINAAFAFADWVGLLVSLGISTYLTKEVARRGAAAGPLVLNALLLRTTAAVLIGAGAIALATYFFEDGVTRQLVYLLSIYMLTMVIVGVLTGALQGIQQLRTVAIADGVSKMTLLALVAFFLFQGAGVVSVAVAYVLSQFVMFAWLFVAVRRTGYLRGPVRLDSWRSLVTGGMPFAVWEAALLAYARFDVILLSFFTTSAVLGWYYAAYRIISIPLFLPAILMNVTLPALSANASRPQTFNTIARRGVVIAAFTTMPLAVGLMVLADKVIELFGYPSEFSNSVMPIAVLAAGLPLVAVNMIVAPALAALDKQRSWAVLGVGAAILNITLNLAAIPITDAYWDNGAIGAGAVTTLTEIYLLIGGMILLPKEVLDRSAYIGVLKCAVAGAAMGIVVWGLHDLSIFILVPLGGLVYVTAALLLGVFSFEEMRTMARHVLSRTPAPAIVSASAVE